MAENPLNFPETLSTIATRQRDWPSNLLHGPTTAHYLRDCAYHRYIPSDEETSNEYGFRHTVFAFEPERLLAFYGIIFFTIGLDPEEVNQWQQKYPAYLFCKMGHAWVAWQTALSAHKNHEISIGANTLGPSPWGARWSWSESHVDAVFGTFYSTVRNGYGKTSQPRL